MRISTRGRYALQALVVMATHSADEKHRLRDVAQSAGLSEGYLEQLFQQLKKAGLIVGVPGAGGGYLLARAGDEITAGAVLRAVESSFQLVDCLGEEPCDREDRCVSRLLWRGLQERIDAVADGITVGELARRYTAQPPADHFDFSI